MAKKQSKFISVILCTLALIIGLVGSFSVITYINLPKTDVLVVSEEVYYSNSNGEISHSNISLEDAEISIHFLELGNKYTGDCTYIKTKDCDILIDCGSKSNSVPTVANYLNQYVTDNKLEYVIVTHAHQDHYAGFATTTKVDSIFDLYECENIITFSQTAKGKTTTTMYKNFERELNAEKANGANVYTALDCINETNGAKTIYNIANNITLEILDSYYYANQASTENDHSVCTLVKHYYDDANQNNFRSFIFTGDLEHEGEAELIKMNNLPKVDLYKAGHHGSKTSSTPEFLEVIQPKTVCVCCCAGSPEYTKTPENQFPTQDFINNISKYTSDIYVTTLCVDYKNNEFTSFNGDIIYMSNKLGYNIKCSNNNIILKESDWFKTNRTWPAA
ncbi:MAG: MBL fold metallo-hydrolase [Clostridia bacterium]|nr:MBL fold metallo-hydrolase [Clostridia bacterium]